MRGRPSILVRSSPAAVIGGVIALATAIAVWAALNRSFELDEGYTYLILNGQPRIAWPADVFTRPQIAHWFAGTSSFARISADLKAYDVHPPLWFYLEELWRRAVGPDLLAARLPSVALMAGSLVLVARLARQCRAPVALTVAINALSYAVLYTGATVRMYPLANVLLLAGTLALLRALAPHAGPDGTPRPVLWAALAGLRVRAGHRDASVRGVPRHGAGAGGGRGLAGAAALRRGAGHRPGGAAGDPVGGHLLPGAADP